MSYLKLDENNKIVGISNSPIFDNYVEADSSLIDSIDFNLPYNYYFDGQTITKTPLTFPSAIPTILNMAQVRITLLHFGKLSDVTTLIQNMEGIEGEQAKIEWEFRTFVNRNNILVTMIQNHFNWTDEFIDEMFKYGAKQ